MSNQNNVNKFKKNYVMLISGDTIWDIHNKTPWLEFPITFYDHGYNSWIISGKVTNKNISQTGVKVVETSFTSSQITSKFREFFVIKHILNEINPDIVMTVQVANFHFIHIALNKLSNLFKRAKRQQLKRQIWILKLDWAGTKVPIFYKIGLIFSSFFFDKLSSETSCGINMLDKILFINKSKIMLLPNGYPQHTYLKTHYDNGKRESVILSICRVSFEKGLDVLIKAFSKLSHKYNNWKLTIIGPYTDIDYFNRLKEIILMESLAEKVVFRGFLQEDDIKIELQKASIFCLASRFESFGNVRIEAMVNGIPLVTTEAGCGVDFKKFGALVVPEDDINSLSKMLEILMRSERNRRLVADRQLEELESYDTIVESIIKLDS